MVEFKVLAVRDVSFKDDKGKQVEGMQLWLSTPSESAGWRGLEILKLWISSDSPFVDTVDALQADQILSISFNRYGKPNAMEVLQ